LLEALRWQREGENRVAFELVSSGDPEAKVCAE
jgi:hypothetical protein